MKLSSPQQRLLNRMSHGAKLYLDNSSGKYKLFDSPTTRTIDPKTVDVLRNRGLIEGGITGRFTLRPPK